MSYFKELGKKLRDHHKAIDNKVEKIEKYQKYVNTELDYAYLYSFNETPVSINANDIIIPTEGIGNMSFDLPQGCIELKANKVYKVTATMNLVSGERINFALKNFITNTRIGEDYGSIGLNVSWSNKDYVSVVPVGDEDMLVSIYCLELTGNDCTYGAFTITVQEINRQIVVDPVEYVNEKSGIEDAPVGSIINHSGIVPPNHYLPCDGTEYNIIDYPYLAQHFINNYGSANIFGGDGVNTFATPMVISENSSYMEIPIFGGSIISPGYWEDFVPENAFDDDINTYWSYASTEVDARYIGYNFNSIKKVCAYSITTRQANSGDSTTFPHAFRLQGSNDGTEWETIDTQTDVPWTVHETKMFTLNKEYNFQCYRVIIDYTTHVSGYTSIASLKFYTSGIQTYIKYEPTYYMARQNTNYLQPTLYSEEERVIGCWINGKPLYAKTLNGITASETGISSIFNLTGLSIDNVVNLDGTLQYAAGKWNQLNSINALSEMCTIYFRDNAIYMNTNVSGYLNKPIQITIQYTKATDAENSFTEDMLHDYMPSIETVEYSTEEVTNAINELW